MDDDNILNNNTVLYKISVEDIQNVANEEFGRSLNEKEMRVIEHRIGNYLDWYNSIHNAILFELSDCFGAGR